MPIGEPPRFGLPSFTMPKFDIPTMAEAVLNVLRDRIATFQRELDDDHELGVVISGAVPLRVERIEVGSALLLAFHGTTASGDRAVVMQHVSQTNLMLIAMPKVGPVARRVGFELPS